MVMGILSMPMIELLTRIKSMNHFSQRMLPIFDILKLFFIDACRGPNEDKCVVVAHGKTEPAPRIKVPSYGNYILAFSTMPSM